MKAISLRREQVHTGSLILVNAQYPLQNTIAPEEIRPLELKTIQPYHEIRSNPKATLEHSQIYSESQVSKLSRVCSEQKKTSEYSQVYLERKTALVLEALLTTIGSGSSLVPVSGFRTRQEQENLYASSLAEHGEEFTESYVATPGHSEHETGLAIDLAFNQEPIDFLRPYFPRDGVCGRFRSRAASYGFVERYREGKEALTGIAPEPWHFRYVGLPHASIMDAHGFCLEEYLDYLKDFSYEGRHLEVHVENKSFELFYKKAEDDLTELTLPGYLPFQASGDNREGFIFTLWR